MFRLYSKGCEYAIRALTLLPSPDEGVRFQTKEICERAGIPESFTRKVFQALVQAGFLEASRGPGGGYALCQPPSEISLLSIIKVVDGEDTFAGCVMGLPKCDSLKPCPLHATWALAKGRLLAQLEAKTLQDLINTVRSRQTPENIESELAALLDTVAPVEE
jgi:Rrf2 family protein